MVTLHGEDAGNAEREAISALLPTVLIGRLWALVALLLLVGIALGASRLPRYANGQGLMLDPVRFVALFPADDHAALRAGQPLFVELGPQQRVQVPIEEVEPALLDPAAARQRFALRVDAPVALVVARWPADAPPLVAGAHHLVRAEMEGRTLLSLLMPNRAGGGESP